MGHLSFNEAVAALNGGRRPRVPYTNTLGALGGKKSRALLAQALQRALQDQKHIESVMREAQGIESTIRGRLNQIKAQADAAQRLAKDNFSPETQVMAQGLQDQLFDAEAQAKKGLAAKQAAQEKYDKARNTKSQWGSQYWGIGEAGLANDTSVFAGEFDSHLATMKAAAKALSAASTESTRAVAKLQGAAREAQEAARARQEAAAAEKRAVEEAERRRMEEQRAAEEAKYARERERQEREERLRQEELELQRALKEEERALREAEIAQRQAQTQAQADAEARRMEAELRREEMQYQMQQQQMEWQRQQAEREAERAAAQEEREAAREALMLQLELAREGLAPSPFGPAMAPGMPQAPGYPGMAPGYPGMAPGYPGMAPGYPGMATVPQGYGMPQAPGFYPGALPGAAMGPGGVSVPPMPGAFTPAVAPGAPMPQVAPPSFMPPYQQSTGIQATAGQPGGFFQPASFSPGSELFGMGDLGVADARVINTTGARAPLAGAKIKMGYKLHGPRNGQYIMERPDGSTFAIPATLVEAGAGQPITEDDGTVIYEPPRVSGAYHQQQASGLSDETTAAIRDIAVAAAQSATQVISAREQRKLEEARLKSGGGLPALSFTASESVSAGNSWVLPVALGAIGLGVFAAFARKKKK